MENRRPPSLDAIAFPDGPYWYWWRKLADAPETDHESTPAAPFVPVHLAEEPATPVVDIVLTGGERLQVRPGASADLLRAVVTALRAGC